MKVFLQKIAVKYFLLVFYNSHGYKNSIYKEYKFLCLKK